MGWFLKDGQSEILRGMAVVNGGKVMRGLCCAGTSGDTIVRFNTGSLGGQRSA